jgi:two-component system, cell cycle sensor histidine kinase and response regulator CckA
MHANFSRDPASISTPWAELAPNGEILGADPAFLNLLGFDSEAELREWAPRIQDLYAQHQDRARLEEAPLAESLSAEEVRWIRRDGTSVWVRVRAREGDADGEGPRRLRVEAEDVTGRRHLEAQLRHAQKLESLGQLAGGMAADMNNMFTAILAHAELMDEALAEGDLERARSDLSEVRRNATTGSRMIKHLLSYSRGERLKLRKVSLADAVRDAMRLVRPILPANVELNTAVTRVEPVLADPAAVEQMVVSVVTHALDYVTDGGHIEIQVGRGGFDHQHLRLTGWGDPGDYGVVTITDDGRGMAAQTVSRLFQPFQAPHRPEGDLGLSLSVVYGLMKQHRGFIEVESEPGAGTTVRLYFRLARISADALAAARGESGAPAASILFVEDDESLRRVAGRVLRSRGYRVLEADHGLAAMELMDREGMPDLVITDLVMPSMTGLELVRRMEEWDRPLPAILLTSGYSPDFLEGPDAEPLRHPFLEKPWTLEQLLSEVRAILSGDDR